MNLALALLLLWPQAPPKKEEAKKPASPPATTALVGGDVYTITRGVRKGATILIRDGKILRVGQGLALPEGTKKIDVTGKRVLPGYVAVRGQRLGLSRSGSSGKISDSLDPYSESIRIALASGITTVHVETGGGRGFFGGSSSSSGATAVIKMTYGSLDGMVLREPGSLSLRTWVSGSGSQRYDLRSKLLAARDHLRKLRDYEDRKARKKLKPNEKPPRATGSAGAYLKLLKGEDIARMPARGADQIRRALELVNEFRFPCVLTDVVEGWTIPDEIGRARAYCVVTPRTKIHPSPNAGRPSGSSIEQAARLRRAGVRFAILPTSARIGTGGIAGRDLGYLPLEAAFAVRGGLDEQTALEAITITAAEICGVDGRVGSIEEGKDADLIVLDGDPLDYRTFVDLTFVNGKLLYDKAKSPYFSHLKAGPRGR